jgi:hypothetical protein
MGHPALLVVELQLLIFIQIWEIELPFVLRTLTVYDFSSLPLLAACLHILPLIYRSFCDLSLHQYYIIQIIIHHPFQIQRLPLPLSSCSQPHLVLRAAHILFPKIAFLKLFQDYFRLRLSFSPFELLLKLRNLNILSFDFE